MAPPTSVALVDEPARVRLALSPVRRRLLERLAEPASATQLAAELGLPRQRVNYHVRRLEAAGLVELVEERPRRGFTERVLRSAARSFLIDPDLLGEPPATPSPHRLDRFAADHLVTTAAGVVRDVTHMRDAAARGGRRLLTFTLETEVRLAAPADVERLANDLAAGVAGIVARFEQAGGRRFRLVLGGLRPRPRPPHPSPTTPLPTTPLPTTPTTSTAPTPSSPTRSPEMPGPDPLPEDDVRIEVTLPAPFDVVWRWFRDPDLISRWFGWDYDSDEGGLEAEIRMIFVEGTMASEAERTLHIGGHRFALEDREATTVVRVTRAAPAGGPEWTDAFYDDVEEGWISFLHQLRFTLAHHADDERRTLYLSGEAIDPADASPIAGLGLGGPAEGPEARSYRAAAGPGELAGSVWFRSAHQIGLTVDAWGPGLLVLAESATAPPEHPSAQAILTTYGLDDGARASVTDRWTVWWATRYRPSG